MTTQLLATELANLIQESKRKHNDLRQVRALASDNIVYLFTEDIFFFVGC